MRVLAVQPDIAWEDKAANFAHVEALLAAAQVPAGSLIVLPEMFATGFSMNVAGIAESPDGPTQRFMKGLAQKYRATVIAGVVTAAEDGRGLNQAVVIGPDGGEVARYTKMHPFSFAGENEHYAPGDQVVTFPVGGFTAAMQICYDLRFPELYRQAALRGADLLVTIASFPLAREAHWVALSVARGIENQAFMVASNRCGRDPGNAYGGRSMVIDPSGRVVADAGDQPGIASADIDPAGASACRASFPALADIRGPLLGVSPSPPGR